MRHVRAIAERPHPMGGEGHPRVGSYLLGTLIGMGLRPQVQEATGIGTRHPVAGRVHNALVRVAGMSPGPAVLLMAHYDGVPAGPAAADDASGVAVLLETLRALSAAPALRHDVIALFTDGEEPGLLGAAAFVREHASAKDVAVVLNFEARGTRGPSLMFETGPGNLDVVRVLRRIRGVRATSLSTAVYRKLPNDTDLSELAVLDRPAMNFAFIGGVERYHTTEDDVAHLDPRSVQHHGNQALALVRAFGNGELPRPRTSDAVFFNVPLFGLIVYPESWALPLAIVALVLAVGALLRLRKREQPLARDIILGIVGVIISVVVAGAAGYGLAIGLRRLHGGLAGGGSPEWSGIYAAAFALLAFAVAAMCYAIVRRMARAPGAHLGAVIAWALLSLVVALMAPGMSFVFTWPVLAVAAVTVLSVDLLPRIVRALAWTSTLVVIFVLVPVVYLMVCSALGLDQTGAPVLTLFTALAAWLLAPHIESMSGARLRTPSLVAAVIALVLFVIGAFTVRTNAAHPAGAQLVYAVDADSGTAWFTGSGSTESARRWLTRTLQASSPGDSSAPPRWLTRSYDPRRIIRAPLGPVVAPTATMLSDTSIQGTRRVTLLIRPAAGMRTIALSTDSGTVLSATVDGRLVDTTRYRYPLRRWSLEYVAPPTVGFTLALTLVPNAHPTLGLMGRYTGIPAIREFQMPKRPVGIIPIQNGEMTLVYRRLPL